MIFKKHIDKTPLNSQNLKTVEGVNLNKYVGKWHGIASYPQFFQKGCSNTLAEYIITNKGYMIVKNRYNEDFKSGKLSHIKGNVFVEEKSENAKFIIQFFWPFKGKHWITDLADDYSYVVVCHPNKKYLWILSRTPIMDDCVYQKIIQQLVITGFELSRIQKTNQKTT